MRRGLKGVLDLFRGFKWIWMALIIVFLGSLSVHLLLDRPIAVDHLALSSGNPWGVLTGVFVHDDLSHLFNNLRGFLTYTLLFVIINSFEDVEWKRYSSKVFFATILVAGTILSGPFQLYAGGWNDNVYGASTIVYATSGVLLATALTNLHQLPDSLKKITGGKGRGARKDRLREIYSLAINLLIILMVALLAINPNFLGVGARVGKVAHGCGFIAGLAISFTLLNFRRVRQRSK